MFQAGATILQASHDDNGPYVILDRTIFYPQGGGQPSDQGTITLDGNSIMVSKVAWVNGQVHHYTSQSLQSHVGAIIMLEIDRERRLQFMRLHSAGHMLHHVVEMLYPHLKAVKGYHYPDGSYVEFTSKDSLIVSLERINKELVAMIANDHFIASIIVHPEQFKTLCPGASYNGTRPIRLVKIGDFAQQPCGGTHVKSTGIVSSLVATKQKAKASSLKISYN